MKKNIITYTVFGCLALLASSGLAQQESSGETPEEHQKHLQQQLESLQKSMVSPCCYTEAMATHSSPLAKESRLRIKNLLELGKTPEEIKETFVAEYGQRVLITPPAKGFNLLVWVAPFVMLALGGLTVGFYLYKVRPKGKLTGETELP